ncbi:MAG: hypothetical protein KDG50_11460 [Chromatiales bacterium]|nr:hypothetical protein [Chromatiales bacterium]
MDRSVPVRCGGTPALTTQLVAAVLWPSFLVAGAATGLFFTLFDPQIMFADYDISRLGAYSLGFFAFWLIAALSCAGAIYFARPCPGPQRRGR